MAPRKIFFAACLIASVLCLAAGYAVRRPWIGTALAILTGIAWLLARKYPASGLPLICLLASVCLAVAGRLTGAPPLLMLSSSVLALAVWDLLLLDVALEGNASEEQTRLHENNHLQSLISALGFGLSVSYLGRLLALESPFALVVLFVALAVFGLARAWTYIKKRQIS